MSETRIQCGPSGTLYALGVLGAAVYYVQASAGLIGGVVGVIKAFFWPAFLVHRLFVVWGL